MRVDGYWIDVVHGDELIEIQTGNFTALRSKLSDLLERHPVRVVHPIAFEKWIIRIPGDAPSLAQTKSPISRRRSPRRGRYEDIFWESVYIAGSLPHPNLRLELLLVQVEEIRRDDGHGSWRRGGVSIIDRRLINVIDQWTLTTVNDWASFLPPGLPSDFTNLQLGRTLGISPRLASRMTYCLQKIGVIHLTKVKKRHHIFSRTT